MSMQHKPQRALPGFYHPMETRIDIVNISLVSLINRRSSKSAII